jgi:hypothetical protein
MCDRVFLLEHASSPRSRNAASGGKAVRASVRAFERFAKSRLRDLGAAHSSPGAVGSTRFSARSRIAMRCAGKKAHVTRRGMIAIGVGLPVGLAAVFVSSGLAHMVLLTLTGACLAVALVCFLVAATRREAA